MPRKQEKSVVKSDIGLYAPRPDFTLVGKNVKINAGPLKGYYGIVKHATEVTVYVELRSVSKVIISLLF